MSACAWRLRRRSLRLPHGSVPISVLKPVQGVEEGLFENLESFCRQTHPRFELIVGAADPSAPALNIAREVKAKFPQVAIHIVSGQWPSGSNPKIRNLRHLLSRAQYAAILVSDADVRVDPDYLSVMAGALEQPNVGLVSNLVVGAEARSVGSECQSALLSGFLSGAIASAMVLLRHPIVMGKSMLFRRDALLNIGGFAAAAEVLAEDYLLGKATLQAGYEVAVLGYPVHAINRDWTFERALQRYCRWGQIRRHIAPAAFALEPFALPLVWALLLALAQIANVTNTSSVLRPCLWQLPIACMALAFLAVFVQSCVAAHLRGYGTPWRSFVFAPLAAILALGGWAQAWVANVVVWREQAFGIGQGTRLTPVHRVSSRTQRREPQAA